MTIPDPEAFPGALTSRRPERIEMAGQLPEESIFMPQRLVPYVPTVVSTQATLYDPAEIESLLGFKASVPLMVQAAKSQFLVVDLRGYPVEGDGFRAVVAQRRFKADFILVDLNTWAPESSQQGYQGIRRGESVYFGRTNLKSAARFALPGTVSNGHFRIEYNRDGLTVQDLGSTNGTWITKPDHTIENRGTDLAVKRVAQYDGYRPPDARAPYGYYGDYPIIGSRSAEIAGGVYIGGHAREAIVADPASDPRLATLLKVDLAAGSGKKRFMDKVIEAFMPEDARTLAELRRINQVVRAVMRYDGPAVKALSKTHGDDTKLSLGEFVERGIGVCRHMTLVDGLIIEQLVRQGALDGEVRIQRNTIEEYGGAHAWATFTTAGGIEYVIDSAQDFVGTKAQARRQRRWDYYLPLR